jgi:hypothetical protein
MSPRIKALLGAVLVYAVAYGPAIVAAMSGKAGGIKIT